MEVHAGFSNEAEWIIYQASGLMLRNQVRLFKKDFN
jgi:hypothetical protein